MVSLFHVVEWTWAGKGMLAMSSLISARMMVMMLLELHDSHGC